MKTDVLVIAALVFTVGLLLSSISFSDIFSSSDEDADAEIVLQQRLADL